MASITKRENKQGLVYRIQVKIKDKGSGKDIVRSMTWSPPGTMPLKQMEREVVIIAKEYEDKIKNLVGASIESTADDRLTFKEFADIWLEKTKQENTLTYYVNSLKCVKMVTDLIGGYKLSELTPRLIQTCYDKLDKLEITKYIVMPKVEHLRKSMLKHNLRYTDVAENCTKHILTSALGGLQITLDSAQKIAKALVEKLNYLFDVQKISKPYAHETIHKVKRTVRAILSVAKKQRLINDNYAKADYINFPKRPPHEIQFLNDEQAKLLYKTLSTMEEIKPKTAIMTLLLTGIRRGELCGLEWNDIDFNQGTMKIERSITAVTGYGVIEKCPKTESSKRTLSLPDSLIKQLKEFKVWQQEYALSLGDRWVETGRIFTAEFGAKINPSVIMSYLRNVCGKAGLPHTTIHSLRHTNITLQIMAGVPLVTVAGRAGHSKTSTTTDVYSHFLKSNDKIAADKINEIFS